jgi:hypothetical protein
MWLLRSARIVNSQLGKSNQNDAFDLSNGIYTNLKKSLLKDMVVLTLKIREKLTHCSLNNNV